MQKPKRLEQNFSPSPIFHGEFERKNEKFKYEKPPWREKQNKLLPKCYCFCPALRPFVTWHGPALKMPARKPARPVLRALGVSFFFVRSALKKKRTGIHKMLLYSFIFSPQIVHKKKDKQTTKNNVKVKKEKEKIPPAL